MPQPEGITGFFYIYIFFFTLCSLLCFWFKLLILCADLLILSVQIHSHYYIGECLQQWFSKEIIAAHKEILQLSSQTFYIKINYLGCLFFFFFT